MNAGCTVCVTLILGEAHVDVTALCNPDAGRRRPRNSRPRRSPGRDSGWPTPGDIALTRAKCCSSKRSASSRVRIDPNWVSSIGATDLHKSDSLESLHLHRCLNAAIREDTPWPDRNAGSLRTSPRRAPLPLAFANFVVVQFGVVDRAARYRARDERGDDDRCQHRSSKRPVMTCQLPHQYDG